MGGGEDGALARGAVTMAVWLLGGLALWPRAWRLLGGPGEDFGVLVATAVRGLLGVAAAAALLRALLSLRGRV